MKLIHLLILRLLPGPFLGWLGTLLFLLLLQFLMKFLPDLAGRDLPLGLVLELIAYNLAYMVVLAVPMSVLLAALMAFGTLAESRTWVVIKNCGISLWQLIWPVLVAATVLTGCMVFFNNNLLPESNYRARNIWQDIRSKRPGFELQPGVFYEGLSDYSILIRDRIGNDLRDILIYDYTEAGRSGTTIRADSGTLVPFGNTVSLLMWDGEIHRLRASGPAQNEERYERMVFERFHLRLDLSEFDFERRNPASGFRSDRSTPTREMILFVDSLKASIASKRLDLRASTPSYSPYPSDSNALLPSAAQSQMPSHFAFGSDLDASSRLATLGLDRTQALRAYDLAQETGRHARSEINGLQRNIEREQSLINRYQVEIHKKYSIAVACLVFMLIGAPLGLSIRRGGLGTAGGVALAAFLFYWVTLVQGEKLADRDMLSPWIGMWTADILMGLLGVGLCVYLALDLRATPPLWARRRR